TWYRASPRLSSRGEITSARVDPLKPPAIVRPLRRPGRTFRPKGQRECPCGGTGRRARLKIEFRKECWFDSGQGHHASPFGLRVAQPRGARRAKRVRRSLWAKTDWHGRRPAAANS